MVTAGVQTRIYRSLPLYVWLAGSVLAVLGTVHYPSPLLAWGLAAYVAAGVLTIKDIIDERDRRSAEQRAIDQAVRQAENEHYTNLAQSLVRSAAGNGSGSIDPNVIRLVR